MIYIPAWGRYIPLKMGDWVFAKEGPYGGFLLKNNSLEKIRKMGLKEGSVVEGWILESFEILDKKERADLLETYDRVFIQRGTGRNPTEITVKFVFRKAKFRLKKLTEYYAVFEVEEIQNERKEETAKYLEVMKRYADKQHFVLFFMEAGMVKNSNEFDEKVLFIRGSKYYNYAYYPIEGRKELAELLYDSRKKFAIIELPEKTKEKEKESNVIEIRKGDTVLTISVENDKVVISIDNNKTVKVELSKEELKELIEKLQKLVEQK